MRVRRLSTRSEALAARAMRRAVADTGWFITIQTAIQGVLENDTGGLTEAEFSLFTRGRFDFVVCREDDEEPEFAVEFDGFGHDDPKHIERDILKNRLCARAGLPLLRVGIDETQEAEKISVLEWLVERFVEWELTVDDAAAQLDGMPIDEDDKITSLAAAFNSEQQFPPNRVLAERLYRRFRISVGHEIDDYRPPGDARYLFEIAWPGRQLPFESRGSSSFLGIEREVHLRSVSRPDEVLLVTSGRARFASQHRTGAGEFSQLELPWLDPRFVTLELALYDGLVKVEHWAASHLHAGRLH